MLIWYYNFGAHINLKLKFIGFIPMKNVRSNLTMHDTTRLGL